MQRLQYLSSFNSRIQGRGTTVILMFYKVVDAQQTHKSSSTQKQRQPPISFHQIDSISPSCPSETLRSPRSPRSPRTTPHTEPPRPLPFPPAPPSQRDGGLRLRAEAEPGETHRGPSFDRRPVTASRSKVCGRPTVWSCGPCNEHAGLHTTCWFCEGLSMKMKCQGPTSFLLGCDLGLADLKACE